jgi:hypothetical protein
VSQKKLKRLNLGLLIAVIALATLSYFKPFMQRAAAGSHPITVKPAAVRDIRIALPKQAMTELKFGDKGWQMTAPRPMPADENVIKTMLDYLDQESKVRFPAVQSELSKYGLDKPKAQLWLNGTEYDFGDLQPVDSRQYLLTDGEIYLINGALFYRVAHDVYWWMDKGLVPPGAHIVALQLPQATLNLDKKGIWQMAPADATVSADDIQKLMDAWQQDLAISVAPIGKDPEEGEVSLSLATSGQPLRYAILKDPDFLVLARPDLGLQYELDESLRDTLLSVKSPKPAAQH